MRGKVYDHSFDDMAEVRRTIDRYKAYYEDVQGHYNVYVTVIIDDCPIG